MDHQGSSLITLLLVEYFWRLECDDPGNQLLGKELGDFPHRVEVARAYLVIDHDGGRVWVSVDF